MKTRKFLIYHHSDGSTSYQSLPDNFKYDGSKITGAHEVVEVDIDIYNGYLNALDAFSSAETSLRHFEKILSAHKPIESRDH